VGLVEELAEINLRGSRGTVYFNWKGERVGGKVRRVEKGVVWLVTTRGRHVSVPIAEIAGVDVVRYSRIMGQGSKERLRAATYLLLRGDPAEAREAAKDGMGDAAWALGDQIGEFAKVVEAREARLAAAAKAEEDARAAAEAKAAAEADEKWKAATAQGLVGHWKFDEGKGGIAVDASGKNMHGQLKNGVRWVPGKVGGALEFDGRNGHVTVADSPSVSVTGDLTVAAWVNGTSWSASNNIVAKDGNDSYRFRIEGSGGTLWLLLSDGSFEFMSVSLGSALSTGTWYHVAATADLTTGEVIFYLDGSPVGTPQTTTKAGIQDSAGPLRIGTYSGSSENFNGAIDDVRIYNRALAADEVKLVFDGRPPAPRAPRKAEAGPPDTEAKAAEPEVAETPARPGVGTVPVAPTTGTDAPQVNLVGNGGFEEKDARRFAAGWAKEQWGAHGSTSSVRLDRSNPHGGEGALVLRGLAVGAKPGVSTALKLDFGAYEIRYWVCTDVGKTATVGARFAGKDLPAHKAVDEWKQFTDTVTVEKRDVKLRLGFWVSTSGVRVWFDDVEFVRE